MPGRYERVCVGWHCAKVKGHAELKIEKSRVKTFIYDFPKLHHSIPNSFGANVHLRQFFFKTVKVIERSRDVTPRSKVGKIEGAPKVLLCTKYGAIPTIFFQSYGILKKVAHAIFFRSATILKVLGRPNLFSNLSEPRVKVSRHANFGAIQCSDFCSVIVVTAQVGTFVPGKRSKVKWSYK